jgi:hypothetical protein
VLSLSICDQRLGLKASNSRQSNNLYFINLYAKG